MTETVTNLEVDQKIHRLFLNAAGLLCLFIFYAALLPFNLTSNPGDVSLGGFVNTLLYSEMGTEQGQWIAHVIFNLLLTFLGSVYCGLSHRKNIWILMYVGIVFFGFLIEYFQMFIGARGTSIVDVYANIAGLFFGFVAWKVFGGFTVNALRHIYTNMMLPIASVKKIYLTFVIAVVLFPFDFYMNSLQFEVAFATKGLPLFENDMDFGLFSLVASMLLLFPLGVIYQMESSRKTVLDIRLILYFAIGLLFLEILQFFEVSGQSSLPSFAFKLIGFCTGLVFGKLFSLSVFLELLLRLRMIFIILFPVFLYLALKIKGMDLNADTSVPSIIAVIEETSLLPFRYYVEVGSGEALLSFLLNFVIFLPIGGLFALHQIAEGRQNIQTVSNLAWMGFTIAIILELLVLIWGLKRPDVTNVLVASAALPMGYYFLVMISNAVFKGVQD